MSTTRAGASGRKWWIGFQRDLDREGNIRFELSRGLVRQFKHNCILARRAERTAISPVALDCPQRTYIRPLRSLSTSVSGPLLDVVLLLPTTASTTNNDSNSITLPHLLCWTAGCHAHSEHRLDQTQTQSCMPITLCCPFLGVSNQPTPEHANPRSPIQTLRLVSS